MSLLDVINKGCSPATHWRNPLEVQAWGVLLSDIECARRQYRQEREADETIDLGGES